VNSLAVQSEDGRRHGQCEMIRSAHLTGSVSRKAGGLFDAVSRLVQTQNLQGLDVKVFGLWDESADTDLKAWSPVPVEAFKPSWPKLIGHSARFREALHAFAPDISHTHGLWLYPSIAMRNYGRAKKRPYLISPHGMLDPWALKNSRWKKVIAWRLFEHGHLRAARCLRALCLSEARSIRQLQLKNDIVVIPNGIDLPAGPAPSAPPWRQVVEPGRKVLLFLSRIHPKKGLVNLLKAWAKNRKLENGNHASEDWILAIAGWDQGGHESELKQLATELGLAWSDIREPQNGQPRPAQFSLLFLGPQFNAAKAACYHHCDAFVLPSFSEGLPMVVLEAWAYSKPVIMTPECNLPEGFQAGAAIRVETSAASIFSGLNELWGMSAADRSAMGLRAQGLVVERFTWSRVADQLQSVHQWILGGGPKPHCILPA
jgi:glycosyltransferase involved in cell wall biosynthesis